MHIYTLNHYSNVYLYNMRFFVPAVCWYSFLFDFLNRIAKTCPWAVCIITLHNASKIQSCQIKDVIIVWKSERTRNLLSNNANAMWKEMCQKYHCLYNSIPYPLLWYQKIAFKALKIEQFHFVCLMNENNSTHKKLCGKNVPKSIECLSWVCYCWV